MRRVTHLLTGAALAGGISLVGAPAALAQEAVACDAYAGTCPVVLGETLTRSEGGAGGTTSSPSTTTGTEVRGAVAGTTANRTSPATLPFTGGDILLLSLLGAAAVGGGTALVVASRRRSPAVA